MEAIFVFFLLVTVGDVHELNQCAAIDALDTILNDRHVHGGMSGLELFCGVLALQHIHFDVVVVEVRDFTVELQGSTVRVQTEADDIDLIRLNSSNEPRSNVSLVFAQRGAH